MTATLIYLLAGMIAAATPILFAAIGEAVAERSGVLNLSVEGMMATGAAVAFAVATLSGSHAAGYWAAGFASAGLAFLFAVLVLVFLANQVAAGLAVGILGLGLSALVGKSFEGTTIAALPKIPAGALAEIPVIGPVLFGHDVMVYLGLGLVFVVAWVFAGTKLGLVIRAVGEAPEAARAIGCPVILVRLGCVLFGGFMAGLGGAQLALAYTALWAEGLVAGRGWIAVALVVFGTWMPLRIALGAYVLGAISLLELTIQGLGLGIPSQLLSASPYLVTILVLVIISRNPETIRLNRPLSLGRTFRSEG